MKYQINFACSLPGEPGCGCPDNDFHAGHGFEGTPEEAVRKAEEISREIYSGDFRWWIVEDASANAREPEIKKPEKPVLRMCMQRALEKAGSVVCREPEDLAAFLWMPTYTTASVFPEGLSGEYNKEFHRVYFDLYSNGRIVDSGKQKPGKSSRPHHVEESLFNLEEMIYRLNLAYGRKVTHVLRTDGYTGFGTQEFRERHPTIIEVFPFEADDGLMEAYAQKHREFTEKREEGFRIMCKRLERYGSTLP